MKSIVIRPALALALVAALSACGGKAQFSLSGPVTGLTYPGLVLSNGATNLSVPANATTFSFPNTISYGSTYSVAVSTQPAHLNCVTSGGSGTAGQLATISIAVTCVPQSHTLGGAIDGLTVDGLVLTNGSLGGTITPLKDATTYTFPLTVNYADAYGVTVLTQPPGLTCTVSNGVGQMGDVNITNVNVHCAP